MVSEFGSEEADGCNCAHLVITRRNFTQHFVKIFPKLGDLTKLGYKFTGRAKKYP